MANFCSECGSALSASARFCATCGAAVPDTAGESVLPAQTAPPSPGAGYVPPAASGVASDPSPASRKPLLLGGAALLAVAIAGGTWLGLSSTGGPAETGSETGTGQEEAAAKPATLFAVAEANLRDKPSLQGSKVVGSLKRAEKVSGTLVDDERGKPWLKVDGTGHFVSLANLAEAQPPELASLDGSDRIATASCTVLETAGTGATTKTVLKSGAAIRVVGSTADGFVELGLPGGGVGYTPASAACATDPSPAKGAVANSLIQFDPRTCELGSELEPYFEKARQSRAGMEEMEEEYSFPVDKKFRGLTVKSIIVGYEWQGVAFGDPLAKVQTVFRQMGFKIDNNGDFTVPDDVAVTTSLRAANADVKARGQTELTCGV